jgi:hypothetical protein
MGKTGFWVYVIISIFVDEKLEMRQDKGVASHLVCGQINYKNNRHTDTKQKNFFNETCMSTTAQKRKRK